MPIRPPQFVKDFFSWLGKIPGNVARTIEDALDAFFGVIVAYIWHPIRDYILAPLGVLDLIQTDLNELAREILNTLGKVDNKIADAARFVLQQVGRIDDRVSGLVADIPVFVIDNIIAGFRFWIDPIIEMIDAFIDEHWEDEV